MKEMERRGIRHPKPLYDRRAQIPSIDNRLWHGNLYHKTFIFLPKMAQSCALKVWLAERSSNNEDWIDPRGCAISIISRAKLIYCRASLIQSSSNSRVAMLWAAIMFTRCNHLPSLPSQVGSRTRVWNVTMR